MHLYLDTGTIFIILAVDQNTIIWKDIPDYFQTELLIVFSIAFSICGCINCDIIQMQLQILHYRFCKRTVTAKFQMKKQSPFLTVFPMSITIYTHTIYILVLRPNKKIK